MTQDTEADPVLAEGVDEEPIEGNRRLFEGRSLIFMAGFATLYAAFHMAALNGISISALTGIEIGFLPQFPLETWNFRIVHIAGALALGFLLFSAHSFKAGDLRETPMLSILAAALALPALYAAFTTFGFMQFLTNGDVVEMGGRSAWLSQPADNPAFTNDLFAGYLGIYEREIYHYGLPLLLATFGAIALGWFERRGARNSPPPTLSCAFARSRWRST